MSNSLRPHESQHTKMSINRNCYIFFSYPLGIYCGLHFGDYLFGGVVKDTGSGVISLVHSLSRVQLFVTPWTTACQASLFITNSRSSPRLMSVESVMPSNRPILCCPLLFFLPSFPASGSFQMSQLFTSGGQSMGVSASASVLPVNTQD